MKCILFGGANPQDTIMFYNDWAKDKPLTKDVIIHTHYQPGFESVPDSMVIVVFFDEAMHPSW